MSSKKMIDEVGRVSDDLILFVKDCLEQNKNRDTFVASVIKGLWKDFGASLSAISQSWLTLSYSIWRKKTKDSKKQAEGIAREIVGVIRNITTRRYENAYDEGHV